MLVAILASMNAVVNHVDAQAEALAGYVNVGRNLVLGEGLAERRAGHMSCRRGES